MMAFKMILRRLFFSSLCFISFTACVAKDCDITVFFSYDGVPLWSGGPTAIADLKLERRGPWLYSDTLKVSGFLGVKTVSIHSNDTPENLYGRLELLKPEENQYIDYNGDWDNWLIPFYKTGHVMTDANGSPVGVVNWVGDEITTVPLNSVGDGWASPVITRNGVSGQFQVSSTGDGNYSSSFTPSWDGGANLPSTTVDTPSLNFTGGNVGGGVILGGGSSGGGGGSSGGGSSGGGSSGGEGETTENNYNYYTYNNVETSTVEENGVTYHNVVQPSYFTITGSSSGGGSSGGGGGSGVVSGDSSFSFTLPDYSPYLNAIGGTLSAHAMGVHADLTAINENLKAMNEFDSTGLDLSVAPQDSNDYSIDTSEAGEVLETVSGWGFSFGFDNNPIGDLFTTILGNPPTSFGSQDLVWDVDFPIYGDMTVHSSFRLSDWFRPAFRSCILMIVSLIFAIAVAKAVSGAFA